MLISIMLAPYAMVVKNDQVCLERVSMGPQKYAILVQNKVDDFTRVINGFHHLEHKQRAISNANRSIDTRDDGRLLWTGSKCFFLDDPCYLIAI